MNCLLVVLFCVSSVMALDSLENGSARIALKLFDDCANAEEFYVCLKMKAATVLDRIKRVDKISISDNVKIVRVVNRSVINDELTEVKLDEILPRTTEEKHTLLNQMIYEELLDLIKSSTLEISLPKQTNEEIHMEGEIRNNRNLIFLF